MNVITTRKSIINILANEMSYLQVSVDYWHYIRNDKETTLEEIDRVYELREISQMLGIHDEVYEQALNIYDFRNKTNKNYVPDCEYVKKMYRKLTNWRSEVFKNVR